MSYLKIACDMVQENSRENGAVGNTSNADELRKFKELLDENIITAEEFEAKKKQLLENM
jgi:predicted Zn-dependent peptidase